MLHDEDCNYLQLNTFFFCRFQQWVAGYRPIEDIHFVPSDMIETETCGYGSCTSGAKASRHHWFSFTNPHTHTKWCVHTQLLYQRYNVSENRRQGEFVLFHRRKKNYTTAKQYPQQNREVIPSKPIKLYSGTHQFNSSTKIRCRNLQNDLTSD